MDQLGEEIAAVLHTARAIVEDRSDIQDLENLPAG